MTFTMKLCYNFLTKKLVQTKYLVIFVLYSTKKLVKNEATHKSRRRHHASFMAT